MHKLTRGQCELTTNSERMRAGNTQTHCDTHALVAYHDTVQIRCCWARGSPPIVMGSRGGEVTPKIQ